MVARLDGRGFTRLTKEICKFEAPFDERFRDMMIRVVEALMTCGFKVIYGYTQSDEISLLFEPEDNAFNRKVRKYNSTLAGEASATFSLEIGMVAAFDCRIIPLPNIERVKDYFLWRQEDAHRNSLNSYCYWTLRKEGETARKATSMLKDKTAAQKKELLLSRGLDFDKLPLWQKRGVGVWKEQYEKEGFNPITNEKKTTLRNHPEVEYELPARADYGNLIENFLKKKDEECYC